MAARDRRQLAGVEARETSSPAATKAEPITVEARGPRRREEPGGADVGAAEGDQGVEEGGGEGAGQPLVEVELEAVGDRLDQALEADLDPGGQAEQQAKDPEPAADQR